MSNHYSYRLRMAELRQSPRSLDIHADLLTDFPYLGPPNP